jgi:hypothetical protein
MMPNEKIRVIPIQRRIHASESDKTVAELAYNLWLSSAFRGGSPEQALSVALRMVRGKGPARLLVVPKRERLTDA